MNLSGVIVLTSRDFQGFKFDSGFGVRILTFIGVPILGREFRAVVVSTVMTSRAYAEDYERTPNFLSSDKLLNTAITRAKSLVLAIGDPDCLVRSKIGQKWERYLEECHDAGPNSLMGDTVQSEVIRRIVAEASNSTVDAEESFPSATDPQPLSANDLPQAHIVDRLEFVCSVESGDEDVYESSHEAGACQDSEDDNTDTNVAPRLETENEYPSTDMSVSDEDIDVDSDMDQAKGRQSEKHGSRRRTMAYQPHFDKSKMLRLLHTCPAQYVRCTLKISSSGEDAYAVIPDGSVPDILIEGRRRRNRAFAGDEVLVKYMAKFDNEDDGMHKNKRGRVVGIFKQNIPSKFVCQLRENTTDTFVPIAPEHPIFLNMRSKQPHADCNGCIVIYGCSRNPRKKTPKIVEKRCVQLDKAVGKLFIVQYLCWKDYNRHPLGIVCGVIHHGLTYGAGKKVLGVQYSILDGSVADREVDAYEEPTVVTQRRERVIDKAFTIDPEKSEDLDDALAVMSNDVERGICEIGVFVADVSHFIPVDSKLDSDARDIGRTVYDERGRQLCPMLPKRISNDVCSLLPGKVRPVLAVIQEYNSRTGEASGTVRFERKTIRSCCKMSYRDVQMIIDGKIPDLNCNEQTRIGVIGQVQILYRLSRAIRAARLGIAMHYRDVDRTKDIFAHELVEEFMILTNKIVAERLFQCCPHFTPLVCKWEPKQQKLEELLRMCGNLVATSCRLSIQTESCGVSSYQMLLGQNVCPRIHVTKHTLELIQEALLLRRFQDIAAAVCIEGFHPQLALANSKLSKSQQKAMYVCSDGNDESFLKHSHLGCLYTHFTSPIRRYIDLVCHRLVRKYLLHDRSVDCPYDEKKVKDVCDQATFRRLNMKNYQSELELLRFSCQIYKHPVATVAVVEEIGNNDISLFVPYCPHMPGRNSLVRLSVLNASGCDRKDLDGMPSLTISWSVNVLPINEKRRLELPEDDYSSVNADLWKSLTSLVATPGEADEDRYRDCRKMFARILDHQDADNLEETSCSRAAEAANEDVSNRLVSVPSTDSDDSDEWTVVISRRNKTTRQRVTGQQAGPKIQEQPRRRRHGEKIAYQKQLRLFDLVSVQLSSKMIRGLLRPIVQLIHFSRDMSICVEHNTSPRECFANVPSSPGILVASKRSYRNLDDYRTAWMPIIDIESATGSVRDSSTGMSVLLHDFQINWTERGRHQVGSTNIDFRYAYDNKVACKIGDYVCLRYFNIPLSGLPDNVDGEGAALQLLRERSCFHLVCHCRIDSSSYEKASDSTGFDFGRDKRKDDQADLQEAEKKTVEIFIDLVPVQQDLGETKVLLSMSGKPCIAQMIHQVLPYRYCIVSALRRLGVLLRD